MTTEKKKKKRRSRKHRRAKKNQKVELSRPSSQKNQSQKTIKEEPSQSSQIIHLKNGGEAIEHSVVERDSIFEDRLKKASITPRQFKNKVYERLMDYKNKVDSKLKDKRKRVRKSVEITQPTRSIFFSILF